jgi:CubicO group peptidase (beta-lactamase class C family)
MKSSKRLVLSISCCLILLSENPAQQISQKIDAVIVEFVRLEQFSGSIMVAKDGEVLYAKAFGDANKDFHVKNSLKTKFNIGSAGKTFTGVSIMQLAEKGQLKVSDPVKKYLQDFPFGDQITIHHLLTHTSGTYNYFAHPQFLARMFRIRSVNDALPLIYDQKLQFETPGEQYAYSNSGIVILGAIIEKVSGKRYDEYIKENILDPAKMHDTGINYWDEIEENRAVGYIKSPSGEFKTNIFMVPPANADGGIETTVEDLLKYDQALYGEELLSEESKKKMFTPLKNNYGYCWRIEEKYGNMLVWHGGGAPGVSASFRRYIDDRYTLIVLSNYSGGATQVSNTIEAIIFGDEYEFPKPTLGEFLYNNMQEKGLDLTMQNVEQLLNDNGYKIQSSRPLNLLGYTLLGEKKLDMALEILKFNLHLFPDEANSYDSLAEVYLRRGDAKSAIEHYKKALEIDPNFTNSKNMLEKLMAN